MNKSINEKDKVSLLRSYEIKDMRIEDFRYSCSIYEYIKTYHKNFFLKKDGKNIKAYTLNPNDKTIKETNLIISRLTDEKTGEQYEVYYNVWDIDKRSPKSIIDFVGEFKYNLNTIQGRDFFKVKAALKRYIDSSNFVHIDNSTIDIQSKKRSLVARNNKPIKFEIAQQPMYDYLYSRGISKETLLSPLFIGTIGMYTVNEGEPQERKVPAFPIKIGKKIKTVQWLDIKNDSERSKYFAEGTVRDGATYQTNYTPKVNTIILIEAPEKAMAHYQQYHKQMNQQNIYPLYHSSCGQITQLDLTKIEEHAFEKNINQYITCFDNDRAGKIYTINTILHITGLRNYSADILGDKATIKFTSQEDENNLMRSLHSSNVLFEFSKKTFKVSISELFKINPTIIDHRSISKDFLDDLKHDKKLPHKFTFETNSNSKTNTIQL